MNWETYIAFGDSITIGARTYLGYPERTGDLLSKKLSKSWNVINHAVSGFKAIDLARHIDKYYFNLKEHHACVATILIGTNDVVESTNIEDFRIALEQIILKVQLITANKNVILLQIPQFLPGIMYPYTMKMNIIIAEFNSIIDQMAIDHKVRVLKLEYSGSDFFDGVHLNENGVRTFSKQIATHILTDKGM